MRTTSNWRIFIVALTAVAATAVAHDARGQDDVATGCLKNGHLRDLEFGNLPRRDECRKGHDKIRIPVVSEHINVGLAKSQTSDFEESLVPLAELGPFEVFGVCSGTLVLDPPFGVLVRGNEPWMRVNEPPFGDLTERTSLVRSAGDFTLATRIGANLRFTGLPTLHNVIRYIFIGIETGAVLRTEFFFTTEMFDDCNFVGTLTLSAVE
jgi:hypothetical protein